MGGRWWLGAERRTQGSDTLSTDNKIGQRGRPLPCIEPQGVDDGEEHFGIVDCLVQLFRPRTARRERDIINRVYLVIRVPRQVASLQLTVTVALLIGNPLVPLLNGWREGLMVHGIVLIELRMIRPVDGEPSRHIDL